MEWVKASWGKFRCWDRARGPQRLDRTQLAGARKLYDALVAASDAGSDQESINSSVAEAMQRMTESERDGAAVFSGYLKQAMAQLKRSTVPSKTDQPHTTDRVSVQLS